MAKLKAHLVTLPRWFAAPFFASAILTGCALAGKIDTRAWMALLTGLLVMAGGHSFNTLLDHSWTELYEGKPDSRSAEKIYTGRQNVLEERALALPIIAKVHR